MAREKLDQLLENTIKGEYTGIKGLGDVQAPDMEGFMAGIRAQACMEGSEGGKTRSYGEYRKPKLWARRIAAAAAILLLSSVMSIFFETPQVKAFKFNVIKTFTEVKEKVVSITFSDGTNKKGNPPPSAGKDSISKKLRPGDLKGLPFHVYTFSRPAGGLKLQLADFERFPDGGYILNMQYSSYEGVVNIVQSSLNDEINYNMNIKEDAVTKEIKVSDRKVVIVEYEGDYRIAVWYEEDAMLKIFGKVTYDHLVEIIDNLK